MRHALFPAALLSLLFLLALGLTLVNLQQALPLAQWSQALWSPATDNVSQMVFHYSLLPRLVLALLVGAGLGLAGLLFQQVLRNPLAEPTTLGVSSGAQLGITVATLWQLPGGAVTQQFAALIGAVVVGVLVFGVAWRKRLSPVTLILAGLVLSLYSGAVNQIFAIFNHDQLQNMFLWSTGALNQMSWENVLQFWPRLLLALLLTLALLRPLTLMGLDDGVAKNLGLALSLARIGGLTLAILLSAQLVNAAGIIGFIGLFAPLLAKLLGGRRLLSRMLLAPLIGALLLWLADGCVQWLSVHWREIPTGTATALLGVPILLWLLPRLRTGSVPPALDQGDNVPAERQHLLRWVLTGLLALALLAWGGLAFGRNAQGWIWSAGDMLHQLLPWRAPRVLAALVTGLMLGVAGSLIQRLTGNPMASPEVLGISSGAACGVVVMMFLVPGDALMWLLPAGAIGAALTLMVIMLVASRGGFSPERMLLAGMALNSAFVTLLMLLLASGDPRMGGLLSWISGSTYNISASQAIQSAGCALLLVALAPLASRWLTLLPLGSATARSAGMALTPARLSLLLLAAALTASATLTIGPLSFVGLMAPHMARMLGFRRALPQLLLSGLLGAGLMVLADWCGRMLAFPDQIPAGLMATFLGAPYFIWLLRRSG
ncbi:MULTISPECIES: Fe(3+)-hydroxamate ABC transporter permease FhuB [Pantoea]|jgi:iron complex transport system permease protein|uniref:Fe(3+)-hydroxamate ABC transporter permease FhuB n=1 Tax=Pantoea brenneri TaxID=472694 RepID=A0A7Y6NCT9_9GAMM|nr:MULTISPECIES: Fe(3+)-hydroxamate ABC transporter permease FhuB [Pantoea]MBZ6394342.1 Fe(3+)-hydroxamate ABC transporter permease FhuB [Pantoea sp.]MBZ6437735.1 Fe(3+)-hydroxamate ABC transporter permease FhuB [Pantoea sp.]NUY41374.1 Fe(3+)-hydroxamate ABC transporter permease FhuB [Pantoea brenneri]NUY48874.1 Fe(3+)-hydroxamate ABC transporter permease FhuB [Pantoea brenneri]NUY59404.1 Fe(3+)-hydroxamate ABC transporter permease FhuB [Pantoea brenneri]